ncbi:MAG: PQQ-binding-like beta-propeller repeat protein, partial [Armatimonadetes bacterium]|nr:PQQ-binding-like beta-propeller repeat protein [Armatimonadota bacterium]
MHLLFGLTLVLSPVHAGDWPHWRGPNRDGTATEDSGWERGAWPPKEVWQASVGLGPTSPLVVGGRLYTLGWDGGSDHVLCLDAATGKEAWRQSYPGRNFGRNAAGDQGMYGGPASTPEYDEQTKYLYTLSIDGDLRCWDTGQQG